MRRSMVMGLAGGALLAGAIGAAVLPGDGESSLPPVEDGASVPLAYRVVYEVDTGGARTTEELVVRRPFDARLTVTDADGQFVSERSSSVGALVTRSRGGAPVEISVPIAPATGDQRLAELLRALIEAGEFEDDGYRISISGRACRLVIEDDVEASLQVERCIDAQGLVLRERWLDPDGTEVMHKQAVELELGDVGELELPEAEPMPADEGNGAVERDDDIEVPFVEVFTLEPPEGFEFGGRYVVAPPRLGLTDDPLVDDRTALITEVWTRGPDLVLFDQGATSGGPPPFDPATVYRTLELDGLGPAELAVDTRVAEIRLTREEGGFVRIAGTLPPDELLELAGGLELEEER